MKDIKIVALALLLAVMAGGSAAAEDKAPEPDLSGTYTYTTTFTLKLRAPEAKTLTDTSKGQLSVSGSAKADLLFTWAGGGLVCHLKAKRVDASSIKFIKGQTCTQEDDASKTDLTLTLETGSGRAIEDELTLNFSWKLSGVLGGEAVSGSATETTTCEKQ